MQHQSIQTTSTTADIINVSHVDLDDVLTEVLVRDRKDGIDYDLPELIASIRDIGLSNPIRVKRRKDGKFDLIQGFRRLSAFRQLRNEDGTEWATIPANILPHGEAIPLLYRQMVDENLIRKDLSFAEMAAIAQTYAADPETRPANVEDAVGELFKSANYSKRSYIRAFARLLDYIGPALQFPHELPRNLGLKVLGQIEKGHGVTQTIKDRLNGLTNRSVQEELDVLRDVSGTDGQISSAPKAAIIAFGPHCKQRPLCVSFDLNFGGKRVRCRATNSNMHIRTNRDLTEVDHTTLQAAVQQFLEKLDENLPRGEG